MDALEKRCIIEFLSSQYRRAKKREKGRILDEACERLEVSRRQAKRLLKAKLSGRPRKPDERGRPSKYQDREFISALKFVWRSTCYMCSRHLKAAMPEWLPPIEVERGKFLESIHERLLSISAPTIDRILRPYKALKGKSFTRSGGFRDEIPIQENIWNIKVPGYLESDTVAHCGGSMFGEFVNSVVMVDIATTWTEARAVFGRGSGPVVNAVEDIESNLPFIVLGYDADNGGEVLNQHILRYFRDERVERGRPPVQVTRAREYRKNDNAHVEQRNNSLARRWLGYERLDFIELVPLINHYYAQIVCPLMNHFFPSFKLHDKVRVKSRTRRIYKDPVTPFTRVMNSPDVPQQRKDLLKAQHDSLNPVTLVKQERIFRKRIDDSVKKLRQGKACPVFSQATSGINPFIELNNVYIFRSKTLPLRKTNATSFSSIDSPSNIAS